MATILKNPDLPDYFLAVDGVSLATPLSRVPTLIDEYEAGKVIAFPDLKVDIDFDYWAALPADQFAVFKKMMSHVNLAGAVPIKVSAFDREEVPLEMQGELYRQMLLLLEQIMPIYAKIFEGYSFSKRRAVWRLQTIHGENLHYDTYKEEYPEHFARMFINLDNQPRIWHTSHHVEQIFEKFGHRVPAKKLENPDVNRFWRDLQIATFGTGHPFDNEPRHIAYFDPGDVWLVDSRQVAHQIFYGRRALSIDFVVPLDSMRDPSRHYMSMANRYRDSLIGEAA